ncbi:hypothetical protein [Streptomyces marincola]|uniref:hypothetical protein n=1 Tax=Streptomyces marincola TaxID=2878388 RepID=UPI001CF22D60|nr:hypothetical protein [Streptomyces marincola]UCM89156.1 hypothetical protein LC193_15025 [Streptomyces marincola]
MSKTGAWFDAVRVAGAEGERAAALLAACCEGEPGPVVGELVGARALYFLLPAGAARAFDWPRGARAHGAHAEDAVTFVGVPALRGDTWPLFWFARPTRKRPFVEARLLHVALGATLTEVSAHAPS